MGLMLPTCYIDTNKLLNNNSLKIPINIRNCLLSMLDNLFHQQYYLDTHFLRNFVLTGTRTNMTLGHPCQTTRTVLKQKKDDDI